MAVLVAPSEGSRPVARSVRCSAVGHLQDAALEAGLLFPASEQSRASRMLKDLADALVGLGRALEILLGPDLLRNIFGLQRNESESMVLVWP